MINNKECHFHKLVCENLVSLWLELGPQIRMHEGVKRNDAWQSQPNNRLVEEYNYIRCHV